MEIPVELISGAFIVPTGLVGAVYLLMCKRIDKLELGLNKKIEKEVFWSEISHVKELVENHTQQNTKEHTDLVKTLMMLGKKHDATNVSISEIAICLAVLTEKIPCQVEKEVKKVTGFTNSKT